MCRDRMLFPPHARWGQKPCSGTGVPRARLHTAQLADQGCAAAAPACGDALLRRTASDCSSDRSSGGSSPPPPDTPPRALELRTCFVSPVKDPPASPFAGVRDEASAEADAARRLGRGQQSFMAALRARDQAARDQIAALAAARAAAALGGRRGSGGPRPGSPRSGPGAALSAGSGSGGGCAVLSRISAVLDATARTGAAVSPCLERHRVPVAALADPTQGPRTTARAQPRGAAALIPCLDRQLLQCVDRLDAAPSQLGPPAASAHCQPPAAALLPPAAAFAAKPSLAHEPCAAEPARCIAHEAADCTGVPAGFFGDVGVALGASGRPFPDRIGAKDTPFFGDVGVVLGLGAGPREGFGGPGGGEPREVLAEGRRSSWPPRPERRAKPCTVKALGSSCRARAAALADAAVAQRISARSSPAKGLEVHPTRFAPHTEDAKAVVQRTHLRLPCAAKARSMQREEEGARGGGSECGWLSLIRESRSFMEDAGFDAEAFWGGVVTRPATPEPL